MRAEEAVKLTEEALAKQISTILALVRDSASDGKYHATYTDREYSNQANFIVEALTRLGYKAHAISGNSINISW